MRTITVQEVSQIISDGIFIKESKRPLLLAIDGRSASGKTTLAEKLAQEFSASVIHMDDFFLPVELRTPERFAMPGGNVHYERFQEEIIEPFQEERLTAYRRFNCKVLDYEKKPVPVSNGDILIVEGAYSTLPIFGKYYDFSVFMDITKEEQVRRIRNRNGEEKCKQFVERWIPLEESYIEAYGIDQKADYVLRTD